MMENTCIIVGTRPEVIRMSPVVRACERQGADWFMGHTGQARSWDAGRVFSEGLGLPDAGVIRMLGRGQGGGNMGGRRE